MAPDEYAGAGGGGKLKLKGGKVSEGRVEKKKKKKEKALKKSEEGEEGDSKKKEEEKERDSDAEHAAASEQTPKTEAERKYEKVRRKRLHERLQRDGIKTHKERVEELNKYLSRLSEHHDMPKIGPG